MKLFRVIASFEVEARDEDDACKQIADECPCDICIESVREIATVDTILKAIDAVHGSEQ